MTARKAHKRLVNPDRLREAWGGWQPAPVHVVTWPAGHGPNGTALCGDALVRPALYPMGTAAFMRREHRARLATCSSCFTRAARLRSAWLDRVAEAVTERAARRGENVVPLRGRAQTTPPAREPGRRARSTR